MKIIESYYENIDNLPKEYILISISGDISDEIKEKIDLWERRLAPSWSIYKEYKDTGNELQYTKRFIKEIVSKIDYEEMIDSWKFRFGCNKTFVLLCYEKPEEFCHRHLVLADIDDTIRGLNHIK